MTTPSNTLMLQAPLLTEREPYVSGYESDSDEDLQSIATYALALLKTRLEWDKGDVTLSGTTLVCTNITRSDSPTQTQMELRLEKDNDKWKLKVYSSAGPVQNWDGSLDEMTGRVRAMSTADFPYKINS